MEVHTNLQGQLSAAAEKQSRNGIIATGNNGTETVDYDLYCNLQAMCLNLFLIGRVHAGKAWV